MYDMLEAKSMKILMPKKLWGKDLEKQNSPISFVSCVLKSLDIFLVIMLVEALHFSRITLLDSSFQCGVIFLTHKNLKYKLNF
jgi:hypothetical protein